jgi:hypothetical protein
VSPHAGTEVWPPDALVPGVSPRWKGLGMAEPSRLDPVKRLSNFVRTAPSFVRHRAEFSWLRNILQEIRSATSRHALQGEAIKVYRRAGNIRGVTRVVVETIETNLTLVAVRVGTLVNPQPLYFSDTAFSPALPCARS